MKKYLLAFFLMAGLSQSSLIHCGPSFIDYCKAWLIVNMASIPVHYYLNNPIAEMEKDGVSVSPAMAVVGSMVGVAIITPIQALLSQYSLLKTIQFLTYLVSAGSTITSDKPVAGLSRVGFVIAQFVAAEKLAEKFAQDA